MRRKYTFKILIALSLLFVTTLAFGQEQAALEIVAPKGGGNAWVWGLTSMILFMIFLMINVFIRLKKLDESEPEKRLTFKEWWATIDAKFFTKAIPLEKEEEFILDHEYDGIRELDNSLPPWWKYGFYATIVVAFFYLLRFHVWKTGPNPEQEYNTEMRIAAAEIEAYRKSSNDMVDEKTVTMSDAAGIAAGKQIFNKQCFVCHGMNGEGGVGPNLTDDYWLHGGSINDVFKTLKYGVSDKGMPAWEKAFSPSEIKNIASYVKSLKGTKPANAKSPQGELFAENELAKVQVDTATKK